MRLNFHEHKKTTKNSTSLLSANQLKTKKYEIQI